MKYKRILLKLSGEALMGNRQYGIDPDRLAEYANDIKQVTDLGVEVAIVIGGGNIFRGVAGAINGMDRVQGDHMGMLATVINGLALQSALEDANVPTRLQSAIQINEVGKPVNQLSVQYDGEQATLVAHGVTAEIRLISLAREESFLSDDIEITREASVISIDTEEIVDIRMDIEQREMYVADVLGYIYFYDIKDKTKPRLVQKVRAVEDDVKITAL